MEYWFQVDLETRGIEGKILAANYARNNNVPYLGICLGLQIATIEFCRNVLGMEGANSTEFDEIRHILQWFSCLKYPRLILEEP